MSPDTKPNPPVCNDACGTLPECAPLAVPYVPYQQTGSQMYGQNDALNNGTLFPGLDLPFHLKKDASNVVCTPLAELQALEFVLVELALYLDTHPDDAEAFALYQQYADMERQARSAYEAVNGPLTLAAAAQGDSWSAWLKGPWPWTLMEGGKG